MKRPVTKKRVLLSGVALLSTYLLLEAFFYWDARSGFTYYRTASSSWACGNTLRQIEGAKSQVAMRDGLRSGDPVAPAKVNQSLDGEAVCYDGGTYIYGNIGVLATCSLDGQMLPDRPVMIRKGIFQWERAKYYPKAHVHHGRLVGY